MERFNTRRAMSTRIFVILIVCVLPTFKAVGQKVRPFVKGGLTIGLFDGTAASDEDYGHFGLNMGGGVQIPISKNHNTYLEPSFNLIPKGNVYDVPQAGGRVTFSLMYLEAQIDFVYRWQSGRDWRIPIGTGLYGAYGLKGKVSATNGISWYNGIPVGESLSMFDDVIGASRWDAGWRVWTVGVEYRQFMFRWDFELGFFSQFRNRRLFSQSHYRRLYALEEDYFGGNWATSLNFGYLF